MRWLSMTRDADQSRTLSRVLLHTTGVTCAASLLLGLLMLGELLGAFGDPDRAFVEYFEDTGNRVPDVVGALLLVIGAGLYVAFFECLSRSIGMDRSPIMQAYARSLVVIIAALVIVSAAALATVNLSRLVADLLDETETPLEGNQVAILPQFGYMLLLFGAAWTAAVVVVLVSVFSRSYETLPPVVVWLGFFLAFLLLLSPTVMMFAVLPIWMVLVAFTARPSPEIDSS